MVAWVVDISILRVLCYWLPFQLLLVPPTKKERQYLSYIDELLSCLSDKIPFVLGGVRAGRAGLTG